MRGSKSRTEHEEEEKENDNDIHGIYSTFRDKTTMPHSLAVSLVISIVNTRPAPKQEMLCVTVQCYTEGYQ